MAAYYNENDPFAAQWLRNLIAAGHIAAGNVDERNIKDVKANDLHGYTQCHFFAGIGGWSYALHLASWPDDKPVWTGSCPCQPFSVAGKQTGVLDERHLWPDWFRLIQECRPATIFGEQVNAAIRHGWLDAVFADLEGEGYACGAAVLPACGVGAPHIRQRLWFVADANGELDHATSEGLSERPERAIFGGETRRFLERSSHTDTLAHTLRERGQQIARGTLGDEAADGRAGRNWQQAHGDHIPSSDGENGELDHATSEGLSERPERAIVGGETRRFLERSSHTDTLAHASQGTETETREWQRLWDDPWASSEFIPCADGAARPVESGTFPLAHGLSDRVGLLRGYGNAIVPQVAAEFIKAYMSL